MCLVEARKPTIFQRVCGYVGRMTNGKWCSLSSEKRRALANSETAVKLWIPCKGGHHQLEGWKLEVHGRRKSVAERARAKTFSGQRFTGNTLM
jgi:hypothetical protein